MSGRPKFPETFAKALRISAKVRGAWAYVPHWLIACMAVGAFAAYKVPAGFWADTGWGTLATVYSGILTFDGLLLAVGWSAFSRVYEIIGSPAYSSFMRRNDILDVHLVAIDLVLICLTVSAVLAGAGLILTLCPAPVVIDSIVFAGMIGSALYSLIQTRRASGMMHDLIWERAEQEGSERLPPADGERA